MILYSHINSKSHLKIEWRHLLPKLSHTYNKELDKRAAETSNIINVLTKKRTKNITISRLNINVPHQ